MTVIREVFGEWEDVVRDAAVKLIFKGLQQDGLAARRLGSKIHDKLESHLTAAEASSTAREDSTISTAKVSLTTTALTSSNISAPPLVAHGIRAMTPSKRPPATLAFVAPEKSLRKP